MKTIKFATLENEAVTIALKQHAYIEAERGAWYSEKYQGNKQLCGKGGVHDGDKFVSIDEINDEGINQKGICKKCLKIYNDNFKNK
jgi:hypothetical protein